VPEVDELVAGGVVVVLGLVVPVFVPLWPEPPVVSEPVPVPTLPEALELPVPVVPMLASELELEPVSVSVVLHAASDRAMTPPSRTVWILFIRVLLDVVGSDHHARCAVHVK